MTIAKTKINNRGVLIEYGTEFPGGVNPNCQAATEFIKSRKPAEMFFVDDKMQIIVRTYTGGLASTLYIPTTPPTNG